MSQMNLNHFFTKLKDSLALISLFLSSIINSGVTMTLPQVSRFSVNDFPIGVDGSHGRVRLVIGPA